MKLVIMMIAIVAAIALPQSPVLSQSTTARAPSPLAPTIQIVQFWYHCPTTPTMAPGNFIVQMKLACDGKENCLFFCNNGQFAETCPRVRKVCKTQYYCGESLIEQVFIESSVVVELRCPRP